MDDKIINGEENENVVVLTDEDGNDIAFEIIAECQRNDTTYYAMIPVEEEDKDSENCEYVILKLAKDGDEDILVTIDDDDELDDIADYFDDAFASEFDYDN